MVIDFPSGVFIVTTIAAPFATLGIVTAIALPAAIVTDTAADFNEIFVFAIFKGATDR